MNKKIKREVQKELRKILENERSAQQSQTSETFLPIDESKTNKVVAKSEVITRKLKEDEESSESEFSSMSEEESDSDSSDDSETYKYKKSKRNRRCQCSKNFKYFKSQFKKLLKNQNSILLELENFRTETLLSPAKNEQNYSVMLDNKDSFEILGLPCQTFESFMEFEKQCIDSKEAAQCLFELFMNIKENDLFKYIRTCMKRVLIDDIAIKFSWYGFQNNVAVKGFIIIRLLKDACVAKFAVAAEDDVLKTIKKWFHYAKDRVKKIEKKQTNISLM